MLTRHIYINLIFLQRLPATGKRSGNGEKCGDKIKRGNYRLKNFYHRKTECDVAQTLDTNRHTCGTVFVEG